MLSNGEDIVAELPLAHIAMYSNYGRIGKILELGPVCVCCNSGMRHFVALKCRARTSKGVRFTLYTENWVELTIDHIKPRYLGGEDSMDNYQVLCLFCNMTKGSTDMSIEQLRERIRRIVNNIL